MLVAVARQLLIFMTCHTSAHPQWQNSRSHKPGAAMSTPIQHDFRSDTVTRPGPAMRAAMASAEVGDDVFRDDPTVTRLEETLAERFGKDAGVFLTSGTQSNL